MRDPVTVFGDMRGAYDNAGTPREKVMAVRAAMLTPRERDLADSASEQDDRTEAEFEALAIEVDRIMRGAVFSAPEVFFAGPHARIGQMILRQCEVKAINEAHRNGTFNG